jgi:hypothetical protein
LHNSSDSDKENNNNPIPIRLGLRQNIKQFMLLILVNAFVGAMIGLEQTVVPLLGKEEFGLDGIESDTTDTYYYVTDNPAGKVYIVNANGTGYGTLIDLHTQGAADLEFIPSQSTIIIPLMQDNKLVAYKLAE